VVIAAILGGLINATVGWMFGIESPLLLAACFFGAMIAAVKTYERLWPVVSR
jgi:hypothetical protein